MQSEASAAFGSVVSFLLQDTEPLHVCQRLRDPQDLSEQTELKPYLPSIVLSHFEYIGTIAEAFITEDPLNIFQRFSDLLRK